jgi:hypothetical protein
VLVVGCATPAFASSSRTASSTSGGACQGRAPRLAIATHFAAHDDWTQAMSSVLERARIACVDTIGVSAGRPEWTYFRWDGHRDAWSGAQKASEDDLLDVATRTFHEAGFRVAAIVDLEAPRYVKEHPDTAAVTFDGERSSQRVSIAELTAGEYRRTLLAMVEHVSARHRVDIVELTELGHYQTSFGPADLRAFQKHSGAPDWPRDGRGAIDVDASSVWAWKTAALTALVRDVAEVVHRHRKLLFIDVPVSWKGLERNGRDSGLEYRKILGAADKIVVWDYFALEDVPPGASEALARHLAAHLPVSAFYISLGMWAKHGQVAPDALAEAAAAAVRGGATQVWLTPNSLVSDAHWRAFLRGTAGDADAER